MSTVAQLIANREGGWKVEQWAAELLRDVHESVQVVGGHHGGVGLDAPGWDVEADGLAYEVKSCKERVARKALKSGSQPGRWKIDTATHYALEPERAQRTMYLLVVTDDAGPKAAYVVSHARMTGMLARYQRQGQFVSLTTSVWAPRLLRIYTRRGRR